MTPTLQKIVVALGIEKLSKDELQIKSQENKVTKVSLHEMLLINASQCKEHMVKVPSYKDIAIEDMLIEDAANVDQLGILKVGSQ